MEQRHTIKPVYQENTKILILGSFPSVTSRKGEFFYHHPQNRFWKVLAFLCEAEIPVSVEEKKRLLLEQRIGVYDVIKSCTIVGSSDSSIDNVVVNDILPILKESQITHIFTNGTLATKLYKKYLEKQLGIKAIPLPSTSSANAQYSLERLQLVWKEKIGDIL